VCYYPEHWQESCWEEDAQRMSAMGIRYVRIGEFAWSRIEPRPGQFEWEWLDRAIAILASQALSIILGTPTACPPKWLVDQHPEILAVAENGQVRGFGSIVFRVLLTAANRGVSSPRSRSDMDPIRLSSRGKRTTNTVATIRSLVTPQRQKPLFVIGCTTNTAP
jgi:hypothetical protein